MLTYLLIYLLTHFDYVSDQPFMRSWPIYKRIAVNSAR